MWFYLIAAFFLFCVKFSFKRALNLFLCWSHSSSFSHQWRHRRRLHLSSVTSSLQKTLLCDSLLLTVSGFNEGDKKSFRPKFLNLTKLALRVFFYLIPSFHSVRLLMSLQGLIFLFIHGDARSCYYWCRLHFCLQRYGERKNRLVSAGFEPGPLIADRVGTPRSLGQPKVFSFA